VLVRAPVLGLVAGLVVGLALDALAWWRAEALVLSSVRARPADPVADARLLNLLDGLSAASGLTPPRALVIGDEAPNVLTLGRSARSGTVVVTDGLVARLRRVELEGVLAHELSHLRAGTTALGTVAVPLVGLPATMLPAGLAARLRRWVVGEGEAAADVAALAITRYPPALAHALEVVRAGGAVTASPAVAHLWLAPPPGTLAPAPGQGLDERIAALREL